MIFEQVLRSSEMVSSKVSKITDKSKQNFSCSNGFCEPDIWGGDCSIHEYDHIEKDQKSLPKIWKKIFDFVWIFIMLFFFHFFLIHQKTIPNHNESTNQMVRSNNTHLKSFSQQGGLLDQLVTELELRQNIKKIVAVVSDTKRNLLKPP